MKKKLAVLLCAVMSIGMMTGCSGLGTEGGSTDGTAGNMSDKTDISIWHDGDEAIMKVIESQVNADLSEENITVRL